MKLRTYILLILLLFALTPMALLLTFGLPPMLDRLQIFYQQANIQQLRADFRDLDKHMASRQALTGVVAKLPEPGIIVSSGNQDEQKVVHATANGSIVFSVKASISSASIFWMRMVLPASGWKETRQESCWRRHHPGPICPAIPF